MGQSLRKRMHEEFNVLCLLAQSFSVAVPSDAASTFVLKMNQLIAETNAAYNRRMGHSKGNSSETPSTEEPGDSGETPTDPGTDGERNRNSSDGDLEPGNLRESSVDVRVDGEGVVRAGLRWASLGYFP